MIHIYTGNGKGKTTSAIGASVRAVGAGHKVFFAQFVKGMHYSEINVIKNISEIEFKQYGRDCFINKAPVLEDIIAAKKGLDDLIRHTNEKFYNLIVLDEVFIALYYNLFKSSDVMNFINSAALKSEIILTGRYAGEEYFKIADLVTEMKEIKHYYNTGTEARIGIEF